MKNSRIVSNEQLSKLYEVEEWLLLVAIMENCKRNDESLEILSGVIRDLEGEEDDEI